MLALYLLGITFAANEPGRLLVPSRHVMRIDVPPDRGAYCCEKEWNE